MTEGTGVFGDASQEASSSAQEEKDLSRFAELKKERDRLEELLSPVKSEAQEISVRLRDYFVRTGKSQVVVDGITIYTKNDLSMKIIDPNRVSAYFKAHDLDHVRKVPAQTLKSIMKEEILVDAETDEWVADEDKLPDELRGAVTVKEFTNVVAKRAPKKRAAVNRGK